MNPADLVLVAELAQGAFGDVFRGKWRGTQVAVKRLKAESQRDARALAEMRAELSIWCRLHHVRPSSLLCLLAGVSPLIRLLSYAA